MKILFKVTKGLAILTTSAFFLAGCGGGGGNSQSRGGGQSSGEGTIPSASTSSIQGQSLGSSRDSVLYGNADSRGNIYATGYTKANLDGNTNAGGSDILLVKYDSSFQREWTKLFGTPSNDVGTGLAIDNGDNVYVIGGTRGDLEGNANAGGIDVFLMKFDASGNKMWTILAGTSMNEYATDIVIGSRGNIYVSGITYGHLDGNANAGQSDIFLMKFYAAGNKLWTRLFGTTENDYGNAITVDSSDNIYVVGGTHASLDGHTNAGGIDLFVMKFNSSGTKQGNLFMGTSLNEVGTGIVADGSGKVYVVGYIYDPLIGTPNIEFRYFSDEIWM